jgi:CelD/BcsL family acetyltransferase involved in cellulose biosynthesis
MRSLSPATRNSLRKRLNRAERVFQVERLDGPRDTAQIDAMIDPLIEMAIRRTRAQPDPHTWRLHSMLRQCARAGLAHVVMLLDGHTPVAGAAALMNRKDRSLGLYLTAFDERYAQCSPGRVVISAMIRDAIDMKMRVFDFLRGEEPYKMQFGGVSRHNRTLIIERPTLQAALRRGLNGVREHLRMLRDSA